MALELVRVVGNVDYAVAIDSGRHIHPGEVTDIPEGQLMRRQIEDGKLTEVEVQPPAARPAPRAATAATETQEAQS